MAKVTKTGGASFWCQFLCSAYALMLQLFCVVYYNVRMREVELARLYVFDYSKFLFEIHCAELPPVYRKI